MWECDSRNPATQHHPSTFWSCMCVCKWQVLGNTCIQCSPDIQQYSSRAKRMVCLMRQLYSLEDLGTLLNKHGMPHKVSPTTRLMLRCCRYSCVNQFCIHVVEMGVLYKLCKRHMYDYVAVSICRSSCPWRANTTRYAVKVSPHTCFVPVIFVTWCEVLLFTLSLSCIWMHRIEVNCFRKKLYLWKFVARCNYYKQVLFQKYVA